ncbi:hypothetical protein [Nostoc sp.]|uniref:hypothetical protein n=1 Tax=Nostoc sp. TaxID=1180 RepID=UPI002D79ED82|nr:hypothetical protein [Nostoc sp.]
MSPACGKLTLTFNPSWSNNPNSQIGLGSEGTVKPKIFDVSSIVNSDRQHI